MKILTFEEELSMARREESERRDRELSMRVLMRRGVRNLPFSEVGLPFGKKQTKNSERDLSIC